MKRSLLLGPTGSLNNQSNETARRESHRLLLLVSRKFVIDFKWRISNRRDKLKSPRCADNAIVMFLDDRLKHGTIPCDFDAYAPPSSRLKILPLTLLSSFSPTTVVICEYCIKYFTTCIL